MNSKKLILTYGLLLLLQTISYSQITIETIKSGKWSDPSIWNTQTLPNTTDNVLIKTSNSIEVDTDVHVKSITVNGVVKPSTTKNIHIQTNYILVMGSSAAMEWGSTPLPYTQNTVITLNGTNVDPPIPTPDGTIVHKGIMAMGGATLQFFGVEKTSWTQLNATALKNATQITLAGQVNWNVGDQFVIASSDYDMNHAEVRTVNNISINGNQTIVNFTNPLSFQHFGELQSYSSSDGSRNWILDERAEVGLLSRNIKIEGDAQSANSKFGGHIMVMNNSKAYLSNVELYRMGQENVLGRYPFHWHLNGNSVGQFIQNCSVHLSYNRAITVHGTNRVKVAHNVCYDNIGHAYFLENGSEVDNIIEYNLGLVTKRPDANKALLPSDVLENDIFSGPATFWISNPDNIVRHNHAAGSKGSGLWLAPHSVLGTSSPELAPLATNAWVDNTAHSNKHGVLFGGQPKNGEPSQTPIIGTGLQTRVDVTLNDHTTYKNHTGSYIRNDWAKTYMNNWKIADNFRGTLNTWESCFQSCLYVGGSANYEERFNDCDNPTTQQIYGHTLYDGPYFIRDSHFAQFDKPNMSAIGNRGASRRTFVSELQNVSTDVQPAQLDFLNNPFDDPHHIGAGIYDDASGTMTGIPNAAIVADHPFMINEQCTQIKNGFNGHACQNRYGHIAIQTHYTNADADAKRQPITITRSDGPSVYLRPVWNMNFYQFNPIADSPYNYSIQFSEHIPGKFTFEASSFKTGESAILEIPNMPATPVRVKSKLFGSSTTLSKKSSYTALENASSTAFYYDKNTLYIKIVMPINPNFNGGLLEYPHSVEVCLTNTCSNLETKEITLSDNSFDWSTSFSNNNCTDYNYSINKQNFTFFNKIKVKLNGFSQASETIEALLSDEDKGQFSLGTLGLNNTNKTYYFNLPASKKITTDEVYQFTLRSCGGFSKSNIQSVELLDGSEAISSGKPPKISKLSTYIPNFSDVSIFSNNLIDDWDANTQVKISNLPNGLSYNQANLHITGSLNTPGDYSFQIEATNPNGGVNTQTLNLQANYIQNASFEFPQQENGDGHRIDYYTLYDGNQATYPQNANWTFTNDSGISANNTNYTKQNGYAPDGDQVAILKAFSEICTEIQIPENVNYLYFDAAQKDCNHQVINVKLNNTVIDSFEPEENGSYTTYEVDISSFASNEVRQTLCFKGTRSWHTAFIDNLKFNECATTACNDGDACTINDVYDNNCNCVGTYVDADADGVCDANDICPNGNDNIDINNNSVPDDCDSCIAQANTACNDNDVCTINDVYDKNCNCTGTYVDADSDGVCDANDICPNGNDNIDTNNNGVPDDCEGDCDPNLPTNILNGGFEYPDLGNTYTSYVFSPLNSDWDFGSNAGISGSNSGFTLHNDAAPEGDQIAFIKHTGSFCQTIQIQAAGEYTLSFEAALRKIDQNSPQIISLLIDGILVDEVTVTFSNYVLFQLNPFFLTAGCHEICFTATNVNNQFRTVFIDDIRITGGDCYRIFDVEDFEEGLGIWNSGGSDANHYNYASYAFSGSHFIGLRDDTNTSTITTDNLNLRNASTVKINFNYHTYSMDSSAEDFWLQISTDGGETFSTIEEWNLNDEFVNGQRYNETVEIQQAFSTETQFRFRCDASSNYDYVFIDDISISTCALSAKINEDAQEETGKNKANQFKLKFAPNPVSSVAHINFNLATASTVQLNLYSISGKLVKQLLTNEIKEAGQHHLHVEVNDLPNGSYIVVFQTPYASSQQKIIVAK